MNSVEINDFDKLEYKEEQVDFKKLPWEPIKNYEDFFCVGSDEIYSQDIEIYVDIIIRKIARKFHVSYEYAKNIIREENAPFFRIKDRFFEEEDYYLLSSTNDKKAFINLFQSFYIPVNERENAKILVEYLVSHFFRLTETQKLEFLERIGKVTVKVKVTGEKRCD